MIYEAWHIAQFVWIGYGGKLPDLKDVLIKDDKKPSQQSPEDMESKLRAFSAQRGG